MQMGIPVIARRIGRKMPQGVDLEWESGFLLPQSLQTGG
jgi:hypothetical protein